MNIPDVKQFIDTVIVPGCKANITADGKLQPMTFLIEGGGSFGIASSESFSNDDEKHIYARAVEGIARGKPEVVAIVSVFDSCTVNVPKDGWKEWRRKFDGPCDDPSHLDTVVFHCLTKTGQWAMYAMTFYPTEGGGQARFEPLVDMTAENTSEHWFSGTMPNPWDYHVAGKPPSASNGSDGGGKADGWLSVNIPQKPRVTG